MQNFTSTTNGLFGLGGTTTMFGTPGGQGGAEGFVQTHGDGLFDRGSFMNTGRGGSGQAIIETGRWPFGNDNQYIETPDGFIQVSGGGPFGWGQQNILVQTDKYTYSRQGGGWLGQGGSTVYRPNVGAGDGVQELGNGGRPVGTVTPNGSTGSGTTTSGPTGTSTGPVVPGKRVRRGQRASAGSDLHAALQELFRNFHKQLRELYAQYGIGGSAGASAGASLIGPGKSAPQKVVVQQSPVQKA